MKQFLFDLSCGKIVYLTLVRLSKLMINTYAKNWKNRASNILLQPVVKIFCTFFSEQV